MKIFGVLINVTYGLPMIILFRIDFRLDTLGDLLIFEGVYCLVYLL